MADVPAADQAYVSQCRASDDVLVATYTASNTVVARIPIGQAPQAINYVARP